MILTFKDYYGGNNPIDLNSFGEINESHQYSNAISSVMDKLTFYVKRNSSIEASNLNESAKRIYSRNIYFNRDERIGASLIFNEMLNQFKENAKEELSIYEAIINQGSLLEEGVEYDLKTLSETLSIDEGKLTDLLKKGKEGLVNVTKSVIDGAKDATVKSIEVVKAKKDDLVGWAKQAKKEFEEKYENLQKLVSGIVKKGIDSVEKFINYILEVFTSLGDKLVDVIKSLGGLKMDDGEVPAKLEGIETDELYKNIKGEAEISFFNNVVLRAQAILSQDKDNAKKLMTESYVSESIVDNKFIAWLAGYKKDGSKMSWWKCILIGLCASLIVWLLPKVLVFAGLGGAIAAFIGALVGLVWNSIGILKLIYRRNKERKPGEKFFDKKTAIFFGLCVLSLGFSTATFLKTVGPLMREICNTMGWTGGDDMSKFGEFIYNITRKISPKSFFQEGGLKEVSEEVKNFGGDFRSNDILQSKKDVLDSLKEMPGATEAQISEFDKFLSAAADAKGTSGVYAAWEAFKDNHDLPLTGIIDTSKWGGSGPIRQAIDLLQKQGELPESAIMFTSGSISTQEASDGLYGIATGLTGMSKDQMGLVLAKAAEIAGKDASTIQMSFFGTSEISNIVTVTETIEGSFDVLAPNVPFLPMVMPFFKEDKWGKYKIRFASATRGAAAYVVDKVEMVKKESLPTENTGKALPTLIKLHDKAWAEYNSLDKTDVNEGKKSDNKEQVEEPQFVVFYIDTKENTGNSSDEPSKNDDEKKNGKKPVIGVVVDTLTLMCCDVCNFGEGTSAEIRRRPQPYFMKGLLSRLSFRPTENNDNDTKEYIRQTLGQTMNTVITQCVLYGVGKKYIDSKVEDKKAEYTLRDKVLGTDKKISPDKELFELGNFSPNELIKCLSDKSKTNKVAYEFLDGKYASKVTIKEDKDGNIKGSATKDSSTIENVKYYRVSKDAYKDAMDAYEKKKKAFADKKIDKKPSKPSFVKGEDGEYYKRLSKKLSSDPANKRKRVYDFVDIRIIPLLKKGELYNRFVGDKTFKKVLYKEDEKNNVKLNKEVIAILKPFLFRPEKTFAKDDEYQLSQLLRDHGVEGKKLGWFKNLFKDEEQLHDTFKEIVEIIWDFLSENRRKVYKNKDFKENHPVNEEYLTKDYTIFEELTEDFINEEFDDETEYEYDVEILNEENKQQIEQDGKILSYEEFLKEYV